MSKAQQHLSILGKKVRDRVTGFNGVASSVSFDLYGCVQVVVTPVKGNDTKHTDLLWFDVARLEITDHTPVMQQPDFVEGSVAEGKHGPAEKPEMGARL